MILARPQWSPRAAGTRTSILVLALVAAFWLVPRSAIAGPPEAHPVQYSVKYVCGFVPAPGPVETEPPVKPGNYATVINIHNYTRGAQRGGLRIAGTWGSPTPGMLPALTSFWIVLFRVHKIDCPMIWSLIGVPPRTFLEGSIHIGLDHALPVAAVYTSQTNPDQVAPADPGAGTSIDVEYVQPFANALAASPEWIDRLRFQDFSPQR